MHKKTFMTICVSLILVACGCAHRQDAGWAPPCGQGNSFASFRAPPSPGAPGEPPATPRVAGKMLALDDALALALMYNPGLASFSWEVRAQQARTVQAGLLPNPEIEAEVENFGGSGPFQGFDQPETTVRLSQLIELGGKRKKRKKVAALERDAAGWEYEAARTELLAETKKSFVDLLAAQEKVALSEDLTRLAQETLRIVSERVKAGKVSPVEQIKAEVSVSGTQVEHENAVHALRAARQQLAALWGSSEASFERAVGDLAAQVPVPPLEDLAARIEDNPEVIRRSLEVERGRATVSLERSKAIPDPTVNGGYRRLSDPDENAFVMGLSMPVPVFDRNQEGTREARYRLSKAEAERSWIVVEMQAKLSRAYETLSATNAEAETLRTGILAKAQVAFDAASEAFRYGKFDYLEVLDAQRTFSEARARYIRVLADHHKAAAEVEALVCEPFDAPKPSM